VSIHLAAEERKAPNLHIYIPDCGGGQLFISVDILTKVLPSIVPKDGEIMILERYAKT